ncbi:MAG: hypothetical protein P9M14_03355 [Candidatus Alcyoniella australis]|nr:hypothetical protein [Candidatus Alcyoniella australis]
MRTTLALTAVLAAALLLFGCGVDEGVQSQIVLFLEQNAQHAGQENIEDYMGDLSSDNVQRDTTRDRAAELFEDYDLSYTLDEVVVLKADADRAEVSVKQSTRKVAGDEPFNDNQVELVYTLVRQDGAWKIQDSRVKSIHRIY